MSAEIITTDAEFQIRPLQDFEPGVVVGSVMLDPRLHDLDESETPYSLEQCIVSDPHINFLEVQRPGTVASVQRQERIMNAFARLRFRMGAWRHGDASTTIAYEQSDTVNPETLELNATESIAHGDREGYNKYFKSDKWLGDGGLVAWQSTIPHAASLAPLANAMNVRSVVDRRGDEYEATDKTRDWLTACTDGQEIRNRTAIMVDKVSAYLTAYADMHPGVDPVVVSVAGGTALPTMQAINKSGIANVRLVLLDGDEASARMSYDLAQKIGFKGTIDFRETDVFSPTAMTQVAEDLDKEGQKAAVVDAVGITEYTSSKLYTPNRGRRFGEDYYLYNPEKFVKAVLNLAEDDGMAIIGQMRADRPNPYFTRGVVGWPTICMRSIKRFAGMLGDAGAPLASTELSLTPGGVYTMASIYKVPGTERVTGDVAAVSRIHAARPIGSILTGEVVQ